MSKQGEGFKYDKGKVMAAIPFQDFPNGIEELCKVSTMGANKYKRHSWRDVPNAEERYTDALARHFLASHHESLDPESGLNHLAHLVWNCLALIELRLQNENKERND